MSNILELDDILSLGNCNAPEEWLAHLTGEGIGNGLEGIDGDVIAKIMNEEDNPNDPFMPVLPIESTPEIQFYQCNSANYTKGRGGNDITHILVHYTAGKQTSAGAALANCKYFNRESAGASAHYFIDSGYTIWQSVSEADTAWHAGNWSMNQRSIGIEVCSAGVFTAEEIERLTWLVQHLMAKYNIPASRVIRHYDVTRKLCPAYYVDAARWKVLHATITGGKVTLPTSKPATTPTSDKLVVDGSWGPATTRKAQKVFGTVEDGVISNQPSANKKYLPNADESAWEFKTGGYSYGSSLIRAIQKKIGTTTDGWFGTNSVKALQKFLNVTVDGSMGPITVKAFQEWLNKQ